MNLDDLTAQFASALEALLDKGFKPPIYWSMIDVIGTIISGIYEYDEDSTSLKGRVLSEHNPRGTIELPVNIMYTDSRGEAVRVVIRRTDQEPEPIH